MKKITLLTTATLLATVCFSCSSLTVNAASLNQRNFIKYGNGIIVSYGSNCDIDSLFEDLLPCLPSQKPCPPAQMPEVPENNAPDTNIPTLPDTNQPENNTPETETPETETPETETPENNENLSYIEQVVSLVNIERAKEGLAPLTIDENVQAAAQVRALECEQSFSHTRPDGSSFATALKEQGVNYRRAGENIAWGQHSPKEVVTAWMNSAGHRANIMNANFTKIGVGYYQNAKGTNYWSQLFID